MLIRITSFIPKKSIVDCLEQYLGHKSVTHVLVSLHHQQDSAAYTLKKRFSTEASHTTACPAILSATQCPSAGTWFATFMFLELFYLP